MIPVFQTRYAAATFGNCFEACVASILEVPLSSVPDRSALVDADAWADLVNQAQIAGGDQAVGDLALPTEYEAGEQALRTWLEERGLAWLDLWIGKAADEIPEGRWLEVAAVVFASGYWIAHTRTSPDGDVARDGLAWRDGRAQSASRLAGRQSARAVARGDASCRGRPGAACAHA